MLRTCGKPFDGLDDEDDKGVITVLDCQNKHLEKELLVIKAFVDRVRYDDKGVVTVQDCHNMHLDKNFWWETF